MTSDWRTPSQRRALSAADGASVLMGHAVPRMARALAFLVLSFVIGHVSVARAEAASPREGDTVTVVVEDEPSCTSNDDFFRRIEARAAGLRRATSGAPARTFIARLESSCPGSLAHAPPPIAEHAQGAPPSRGGREGTEGGLEMASIARSADSFNREGRPRDSFNRKACR